MLVLQLLEATLANLTPLEYKLSKDRILAELDKGRNIVYPVATRTVEMHRNIAAAYQQATIELAKTSLGKEAPEELAYLYLMGLGKTIPLEGLSYLLKKTIERLRAESARTPDVPPAEALSTAAP